MKPWIRSTQGCNGEGELGTVHKPVPGRRVVKMSYILHFGGTWLLPYNLFSKILPRMLFSASDHLNNMLLVEFQGTLRKREAESTGAVSGVSLIKSFTCNP